MLPQDLRCRSLAPVLTVLREEGPEHVAIEVWAGLVSHRHLLGALDCRVDIDSGRGDRSTPEVVELMDLLNSSFEDRKAVSAKSFA